MSLAIQTFDLTKYFYPAAGIRQFLFRGKWGSPQDRITAVERVNLEVRKGELFGLLGPNGAGKTTLVKILCTLILPDSGTATVNGYDISDEERVKAFIGLVGGEERSFYWRLSGRRNLDFFATLCNLSPSQAKRRIKRLSKLLDLEDFLDRRFDSYSSGMKQRLGIARGMLNEPQILFLDEPTKSLDPTAAAKLRETIRDLARKEGYTVVLVTHRLDEAEELCDRIAIMHKGRIQVVDEIRNIRQAIKPEKRYMIDVFDLCPETLDMLRKMQGVIHLDSRSFDSGGTALDLHLAESQSNLPGIMQAIVAGGGQIGDIRSEEVSLEEIFKRFTEEG